MREGDPYDLYAVLGAVNTVTLYQLKSAYIQKLKECHGDLGSSDVELFMKVRRAYAILSNEDQREAYDKTGMISEEFAEADKRQVLQFTHTVFSRLIESYVQTPTLPNARSLDFLEEAKKLVRHTIEDAQTLVQVKRSYVARFAHMKNYVRREGGGENVFEQTLTETEEKLREELKREEEALAIAQRTLVELEAYKNEVEMMSSFATYATGYPSTYTSSTGTGSFINVRFT